MTLKLHRIIEDLADPDREIQILALTTIPRIANDLSPSLEEFDKLNDQLTKLAASRNPDIVFLARKAQNTLSRLAPAAGGDRPGGPPSDASDPSLSSRPTPPGGVPVPPGLPPLPSSGQPAAAPSPPPLPTFSLPQPPPSSLDRAPADGGIGLSTGHMLEKLANEEDAEKLAVLLATARGIKDPRIIEKATPMLSHPDPRVRANAVEVFEESGNESHLSILLPLLHDENNRVRSNAVKAVGRFDVGQVRHCLADMLFSDLVSMRESGLYALINLPEITDLDLVSSLVEDPYDSIRQRLVGYLANHPEKEATGLLEKLVLDKDAKVRDSAVEALVKRCVSVDGLLQQAAVPPEPPVPDPAVTPIDGITIPQHVLNQGPEDVPSRPGGLLVGALVDEAVERGFRATLAQLLKELKSAEKRAILARALYQAGLKGYQACRRGELKDKEALSLYYEIDRYQDFLREYTKKLNLEDATVDKLQRQIVVSGMAQYQGRLKVTLVKLGRLAAEAAKKGIVELPPELLNEIETLAPPPPSGI